MDNHTLYPSKAIALAQILKDGLNYSYRKKYIVFDNLEQLLGDREERDEDAQAVLLETLQVYKRIGNRWLLHFSFNF